MSSDVQSALEHVQDDAVSCQQYLYPFNTTPENLIETRKFLDE